MKKWYQCIQKKIDRQENQHPRQRDESAGPQAEPDLGPDQLAGKTIVRFLPTSLETIGGLERYVKDLDEELLKRSRDLTLIYLYKTNNPEDTTNRKAAKGNGTIVSIPLYVAMSTRVKKGRTRLFIFRIMRFIINALHLREIIFTPAFDELFIRLYMKWPLFRKLCQSQINRLRQIPECQLTLTLQSITAEYQNIDLAVMHSLSIAVDNENIHEHGAQKQYSRCFDEPWNEPPSGPFVLETDAVGASLIHYEKDCQRL